MCWETVDALVSGSYWLGWTVNCPLGISSDVSSGYFIFESSLRLPHAGLVQEAARPLDRVGTEFGAPPLSVFSVLGSPPPFLAGVVDLKSVSCSARREA